MKGETVAEADDTKKNALGAQLVANDKWLVTNIPS